MNIYEITGQFLKLQQMLENGEIDQETFNDTLESLDFDLKEKADNYAKIMKNIKKDVDGLKDEEVRLKSKRTALENKIQSLKTNLENSMIAVDEKKFKTDLFSFGIQKSPASLDIVYIDKIPKKYFSEQAPKLDRILLLADVKKGLEIEGVGIKQSESLRIR